MKRDVLNRNLNSISIFFILLISTSIGMLYGDLTTNAPTFWPVAGFVVIFYIYYKKSVLTSLITSLFFTSLLWRITGANESFFVSFFIAILFTGVSYLEMVLFEKIIIVFKVNLHKLHSLKQGFCLLPHQSYLL